MARIGRFKKIQPRRVGLHPTEVECGYAVYDYRGGTYLLLETYGSDDREIPGKVSQSLQLDEEAARGLRRILAEAFPGT